LVGTLELSAEGHKEVSYFRYADEWLGWDGRFALGPDLPLVEGTQTKSSTTSQGRAGAMFGVFSDCGPDSWGKKIIYRAAAKSGRNVTADGPLNSLDYLLAVSDYARIGALRFSDGDGPFLGISEPNRRKVPPMVELAELNRAAAAVAKETETAEDLRFLLGRGSPLGGARPKSTVRDEDGHLGIGKFPSEGDERSVTRGEVLALRLAARARINAAGAKIVVADGAPVAVIRRFDRVGEKRIPFMSAATALGAHDAEDHAYTEIAEAIRKLSPDAEGELRELWRRIVFGVLITNVDDHLQNHGFLHDGQGRWRLAPAYDVNPMPGKARKLKTWISEASGDDASIEAAVDAIPYFGIASKQAGAILREVSDVIAKWRDVAAEVGMTPVEARKFDEAFEHAERGRASTLADRLSRTVPRRPSESDVAYRLAELGVQWDGGTQFAELRKGALVIRRKSDSKIHNEPPHPAMVENPWSENPRMIQYLDGQEVEVEETPPMAP
jgi:serine/threonine-protein kinase HipA